MSASIQIICIGSALSILEGLLKADQGQVHILGLEIGTHTKQMQRAGNFRV